MSDTLETLVQMDEEDLPESVAIGETEMDAQEFVDRLETLATAAASISRLADDLGALRKTGLADEDVVALLYGRNANLTKGTIRSVLSAIDDVESATDTASGRERLFTRLIGDISGAGIRESGEVLGELNKLADQYPADD